MTRDELKGHLIPAIYDVLRPEQMKADPIGASSREAGIHTAVLAGTVADAVLDVLIRHEILMPEQWPEKELPRW